jgi:hypothetical protein
MIGGLWKSTGSAALLTAAGLYLGSAGLSPAQAADLGGDCCADLEERVAELEATTARKGNRRMSLTISGQVTTGLMYWNDGGSVVGIDLANAALVPGTNASDLYVVDSATVGGSLISFAGNARINPSTTAGFQIVIGLDKNARTHQVTQNDDDGGAAGDATMVMTLANWYLDHKSLGRITVGRANTATAGLTTIDLGGAGVIANASIGYWQRSMNVIVDVGGGVMIPDSWSTLLGGGTVNGASLSRGNVIHYSTPTLGGFSVQAAWGENDMWDVALRYAGEFSGFRVAAGVGYNDNGSGAGEITADIPANAGDPTPSRWLASGSVLHVASGLFLTGAYVNQDNDTDDGVLGNRRDTTLWYVQGGIAKNWTGLGNTVLYGEYARVDGGVNSATGGCDDCFVPAGGLPSAILDSTAEVWGIGIVQHVDAAAMELYLSYRNYSADVTLLPILGGLDIPISDMDVVMGGARVRF